jgi:hypothetical protein
MTGSLFLLAIGVIVLLVIGLALSPIFFIPAAILLFAAVFAGPFLAALRRSPTGGGGGSGVPTTEDAAYDPVQEPHPSAGR